jgi:cobalt/nickel transport system ATP-binding protein
MTPALAIDALRYSYPDGTEALSGVSFSVQRGERIGLVGPNGSGKSTLLLHLNGILPERPTRTPSIAIDGKLLTAESLYDARRNVGHLFQDPDDQLFCPTVYEDVAFGPQQFGLPEDEIRTVVATALRNVGLEGIENRTPHHLSGGEKQRVCLAGILACNPAILVLDEPTNNLDPRGKRELKTLLRSIATTMIIASHDLELVVELCQRTIVLDKGVVVADGPTLQLLSDETLMLKHGLEKPHSLQHRHPHGNHT